MCSCILGDLEMHEICFKDVRKCVYRKVRLCLQSSRPSHRIIRWKVSKLGLDVIKSLARALRWEDAGRVTILLHQMN